MNVMQYCEHAGEEVLGTAPMLVVTTVEWHFCPACHQLAPTERRKVQRRRGRPRIVRVFMNHKRLAA